MTTTTHRSVCPHDCPDCCGLLVDVDAGRVTAVRGDPEHGFTRGVLCPKVSHYERTVYAPGRVLTPLLRRGKKGEGQFAPIGWDEAVARIVERWRAIVDDAGGEAILPVSYAGTMGLIQRNATHALFHKLGASRLGRGICTPAQDAGWKQVMGETPGPDPDEVVASDLVILWGIDALATNLHFLNLVKEARRRGAHVVLIDTWRQPTAALVDQVVLVRPGTDGALALGMLAVLAADGLIDRSFVAAHVDVDGFAALERTALADHAPALAAGRTGIGAAVIAELARRYARARAPFIRVGGGPFRAANGAAALRAMLALPAAVGAWGKKGAGLLASTGTGGAVDLAPFVREDLLPKPTRTVSLNQLGHALTTLDDPRVLSIYVSHCNPANVCPDQGAVLRGLARDDLFTVVHERFLTDTARYADVVLPAPTMLETADLYRSYGQFWLQRTRPVIAPLGQSRSNWDTARALAVALDFTDEVFQRTADEHIDALLAVPSPWRAQEDRAALDAGTPTRLRPPRGRWLTPTGRIRISPSQDLPAFVPAAADAVDEETRRRYPLRLHPAPALHRLNSSFGERADAADRPLQPRPSLRVHPSEAAARGLVDGESVIAENQLGETRAQLLATADVPPGVAVAVGVSTLAEAGGPTVNVLMSPHLTDHGQGSTFSDNRCQLRRAD
ncbi:MAG: molybdopterin-dependent oxidoreductase [Deltaproteobacteria bacterium]|nr:molybdopterin-dependent oxidoreductase [Deltaproteobacteria bacterium]